MHPICNRTNCSIRKLLHPYYLKYKKYIDYRFSNKKELVIFLEMVKLKEKKLGWALRQEDKKNKELAFILGIKVRRFQQLKAKYKETGEIPKLNTLENFEKLIFCGKVRNIRILKF